MLFAYIGPETMMPVASMFAAGVAVVMIFGRNVATFGRKLVRRVWPWPRPKPLETPGAGETAPHR